MHCQWIPNLPLEGNSGLDTFSSIGGVEAHKWCDGCSAVVNVDWKSFHPL